MTIPLYMFGVMLCIAKRGVDESNLDEDGGIAVYEDL